MLGMLLGPFGLLLTLSLVMIALHWLGLSWRQFGLGPISGNCWWQVPLTIGAAFLVSAFLSWGLQTMGEGTPDLSLLAEIEDNLPALLGFLLLAWTSAAFAEEMLARGIILHGLAHGLSSVPGGVWVANGLQAILFGLGHAYQGPSGILLTGLLGFLFGTIVLRTRSLWTVILAHGLIDTITLAAAYAGLVP